MSDAVLVLYGAISAYVENLVYLPTIDSTHETALRLMQQMDEEDQQLRTTVLIARHQTGGHGREGRPWQSPEGGLYLNWVRSDVDHTIINMLPMLAAAAATEAATKAGIANVGIKWPNDLLVDGAKIGGILVHVRRGDTIWATIGLGLNVATKPRLPGDATPPVTCLADHIASRPIDAWISELTVDFLAALDQGIEDPQIARTRWRERLIHQPGDTLEVRLASGEQVRGHYAGVTNDGYLMLENDTGTRTVSSGEIFGR
ncbi:MAG: biotin--[acetyl-CoA-carboxylase] ligase [Acidobacteria bacterium]|nr:biotin--[acetyl-CoA-carboxylase] ligase [Acidobacteriota bacterium]